MAEGYDIAILHGENSLSHGADLLNIFESVTATNSESTALIFDNLDISYLELNRRSNIIANFLLRYISENKASTNPDSDWLVAVCLEPTENLIATLLGIFKAGCAYVPLEPTFPEARISHILTEAQPFCLINSGGQPALQALAEGLNTKAFSIDDILNDSDAKSNNPTVEINPEQVGIVLYTSGSTGIPKGVRIPHRAILSRLEWQWKTFPFEEGEVCCFKTALTFVDSVAEIFAPLLKGIPVVIVPKATVKDPEELVSLLSNKKVSRIVLVPTLLRNILAIIESMDILRNLRFWVCSGEILSLDLVESFFSVFREGYTLSNFYGSTEVMGDVTFAILKSWGEAQSISVDKKVPIGITVDNCKVYLLDNDFRLTRKHEQGEIFVAGRHIALGYVRGKGADKFVKNPYSTSRDFDILYRTGDFGRIVNNQLIYEGRSDSQVKVRGHRVDLTEVDRALRSVNDVINGTVLCYKPGEIDQEIVGFATLQNGSDPEKARQKIRAILPPYMVPQIVQLESIPLLVNGKVDRQSLLRHYEELSKGKSPVDLEIQVDGIPTCQQKVAVKLLKTVSACLGSALAGDLSLEKNFFDIGGNSLNAVTVVMKLKDQGIDIKVGDFLRSKSLKDLLEIIHPTNTEIDSARSKKKDENEVHYFPEIITEDHKEDVLRIIADSFTQRGDLEKLLGVPFQDFYEIVDRVFPMAVESKLCFVMKRSDGLVAAAAINFDAHDEPPLTSDKELGYILELLEKVEDIARPTKIPSGPGKAMHSVLMGTNLALPSCENLRLISLMEEYNIEIAKIRGFSCIFTTNTSAATRDVCDDLLGYEVLVDMPIFNHISQDGKMPFAHANRDQRVVMTVKWL